MVKAKVLSVVLLGILLTSPCDAGDVGFFSPRGIDARFASKVNFAIVKVKSASELGVLIDNASDASLNLVLDFGKTISVPRAQDRVSVRYVTSAENQMTKLFPVRADNKLRDIYPDQQLRDVIAPYLDQIAKRPGVVDTIFLVDEPYLNGVPKGELERAGQIFREALNKRGLESLKLGVLFASAMFNKSFATNIDQAAMRYVRGIDEYKSRVSGTAAGERWVKSYETFRLSTYDLAGNIYTGGGIPKEFNVVAFDFYLSTLLLDGLYEDALNWFSTNTNVPACKVFKGRSVSGLRKSLSFFKGGGVSYTTLAQDKDRTQLNQIFACRMQAVLEMLDQQIKDDGLKDLEIMLIGESSTNGLLEFDPNMVPLKSQPKAIVEARVFDEVSRYLTLFKENKEKGVSRIAFFTFDDEYDQSIGLSIGGVAQMPTVLQEISNAAGR